MLHLIAFKHKILKTALHWIILLLLIFFSCKTSHAQVKPQETKKDTAKLYRNIERYSKRSKFGKLMHKFVFEPVEKKQSNPIRKPKKKYQNYEGKIIRNINIVTFDPFGFNVNDTTRKPRSWGEKVGNRIHIKSSKLNIKNILLLKRNKPLDTLLIRESERLIRTQRYVNSVRISVEPVTQKSDSIDVTVFVLDSWSLIPNASASSSRTSFSLTERNFLGSGHEFSNRISTRLEDGKNAYSTRYTVPNIMNTFIKTDLSYQIDLDNYYGKSVNIERAFYSPFTKYAGGIYLDQQFRRDSLQNAGLDYEHQNFKYNSLDVWAGRAVRIFRGNSEDDRTTNLILSGRLLSTQFKESPTVEYDSINFYTGEKFFMGGIGISSRQFVEDKYLFNNGIIEDVPVGKIYGITGGYQIKDNLGRLYLGARAAFGNYFKWGYLSTNFEYGTFFNNGKAQQTAFSFQANYFTNLLEVGKWKMRQFIKPQLILGSNRLPTTGDYLTINERSGFYGNYGAGFQGSNSAGIRGFNSQMYGTKKFVMTLQTQFYSPWNWIGFRFNPYFNYTAAVLGNEETGITSSQIYHKIGVGLIISNDYLVFSSFQLSIAYFPTIPGSGENILKTNSFETSDFGLQDFELGKPRTIIYK